MVLQIPWIYAGDSFMSHALEENVTDLVQRPALYLTLPALQISYDSISSCHSGREVEEVDEGSRSI